MMPSWESKNNELSGKHVWHEPNDYATDVRRVKQEVKQKWVRDGAKDGAWDVLLLDDSEEKEGMDGMMNGPMHNGTVAKWERFMDEEILLFNKWMKTA